MTITFLFSWMVRAIRHRQHLLQYTLCSLSHSLSDTSVRLSVRAGCKCIVLNSQLFKDSSGCPGFQTEQWSWLKEELANEETRSAKHVLCFCHIPPFLFDADEPDAYFNFERQTRGELLSLLAQYNVKACFCGHYHRNAGGMYKDASNGNTVEVITTAACGTNIANAVSGTAITTATSGALSTEGASIPVADNQYYVINQVANKALINTPAKIVTALANTGVLDAVDITAGGGNVAALIITAADDGNTTFLYGYTDDANAAAVEIAEVALLGTFTNAASALQGATPYLTTTFG